MNISELAIKRKTGVLVLSLLVSILGIFFLSSMSVDLLPQITYPLVRIMIDWKGATPDDIEKNIIEKVESSVATTEDAIQILSSAIEGNATIEVYFEYGKDMDVALADTKAKLDLIRKELPATIEEPRIFKADPSALPIVEVAMYSDKRDEKELRDWVENDFSKKFLGIPGLGAVVTYGGKKREIQVLFDQDKLKKYELSQDAILTALKNENIDFPAGRIDDKEKEFSVRLISKFKNIQDIENTIVANRYGKFIKVKDIGKVLDSYEEQRVLTRFNGKPCVTMSFLKQPNANTVEIAGKIDKRLEELKKKGVIPEDVGYGIASTQATYIINSINNVRDAAMLGGIIAIIVIWLFLNDFRKTLIVALTIPLSLLGTFIIMKLFNATLNIFSLGGIVLAVGMLLDSSIVMLENITRHHKIKGDSYKAGVEAAKEVIGPLIALTLANLAALIPFFFIQGIAALLFRETVITVSGAFVVALLVSVSVIPAFTVYILAYEDKKNLKIKKDVEIIEATKKIYTNGLKRSLNKKNIILSFAGEFQIIIEKTINFYKNILENALRKRKFILFIAAVLFVLSIFIGNKLGREFLPKIDDGKVTVKINLPIGTAVAKTNAVTEEIVEAIKKMPGIDKIYVMVGGYWKRRNIYQKANESNIYIDLVEKTKRPISTSEFVKKLNAKLKDFKKSGLTIKVMRTPIRGIKTTSDSDIDIRIKGYSLEKLNELAEMILNEIKDIKGIINPDISIDFTKPEIHVYLKKERINDLGLSAKKVADALRCVVDGTVSTQFTDTALNVDYDIRVLVDPESIKSIDDIGEIELYTISGALVKLKEVADIKISKGPVQIDREDQVRIVSVTADVAGRNIGKVTDEIKKKISKIKIPEGYIIDYGGEEQSAKESNKKLLIVIILALIMVFSVMAVQYNSLKDPLIIMFTVPLGIIGAFLLLFITRTPFGTTVFLGLIMLLGIITNNAIVLVQFINNYRKDGLDLKEAIIKAGSVRLKPILMVALTAISGLVPIALGWGEGLEMLKPLAIAVLGGLLVGTFLTLFIIPIIYYYVYKK